MRRPVCLRGHPRRASCVDVLRTRFAAQGEPRVSGQVRKRGAQGIGVCDRVGALFLRGNKAAGRGVGSSGPSVCPRNCDCSQRQTRCYQPPEETQPGGKTTNTKGPSQPFRASSEGRSLQYSCQHLGASVKRASLPGADFSISHPWSVPCLAVGTHRQAKLALLDHCKKYVDIRAEWSILKTVLDLYHKDCLLPV